MSENNNCDDFGSEVNPQEEQQQVQQQQQQVQQNQELSELDAFVLDDDDDSFRLSADLVSDLDLTGPLPDGTDFLFLSDQRMQVFDISTDGPQAPGAVAVPAPAPMMQMPPEQLAPAASSSSSATSTSSSAAASPAPNAVPSLPLQGDAEATREAEIERALQLDEKQYRRWARQKNLDPELKKEVKKRRRAMQNTLNQRERRQKVKGAVNTVRSNTTALLDITRQLSVLNAELSRAANPGDVLRLQREQAALLQTQQRLLDEMGEATEDL